MKLPDKKLAYWTPRVISIVFIVFLALFAFDVIIPGRTLPETIVAFLVHLMPNYLLAICLIIAWKYEIVGSFCFFAVGLFFTFFFRTYLHAISFFLVSYPAIAIGIMFIWSYLERKNAKTKSH